MRGFPWKDTLRTSAVSGFACLVIVICFLIFVFVRGQGRSVHEMRRTDVEELHEGIEERWDEWVQEATTSMVDGWQDSSFLKENVPITIAVRYGQNQPVCRHEYDMEEANHWQRLHNYRHMRSMTFALATHIQ